MPTIISQPSEFAPVYQDMIFELSGAENKMKCEITYNSVIIATKYTSIIDGQFTFNLANILKSQFENYQFNATSGIYAGDYTLEYDVTFTDVDASGGLGATLTLSALTAANSIEDVSDMVINDAQDGKFLLTYPAKDENILMNNHFTEFDVNDEPIGWTVLYDSMVQDGTNYAIHIKRDVNDQVLQQAIASGDYLIEIDYKSSAEFLIQGGNNNYIPASATRRIHSFTANLDNFKILFHILYSETYIYNVSAIPLSATRNKFYIRENQHLYLPVIHTQSPSNLWTVMFASKDTTPSIYGYKGVPVISYYTQGGNFNTAYNKGYYFYIIDDTTKLRVSDVYHFNVLPELKDGVELEFLNKYGAFETFIFKRISEKRVKINKQYYENNNVQYTLNSEFNTQWTLQSEVLNPEMFEWLRELYVSQTVFAWINGVRQLVQVTSTWTMGDDSLTLGIDIEFGTEKRHNG